jgi:hypothetical protein
VTKPVIEAYQRHLFHRRLPNGKPLSFGTQHGSLVAVKRLFQWKLDLRRPALQPGGIRALKEVHERTHPGARLGKPEAKTKKNGAVAVEAAELLAALEAEQAEEVERSRRRFHLRRRASHGVN